MSALTKKAYTALLGRIKRIHASWLEDRKENPNQVPYEIDIELDRAILDEARKDKMQVSNRDVDVLCGQVKKYLLEKGIITGSPYGGTMFQLPQDHKPLPTKDELIHQIKTKMEKYRE